MGGHRLFYLALGLIAITIISAQVIAYSYLQRQYNVGPSRSAVSCSQLVLNSPGTAVRFVAVNTLVNYGNSTVKWYNKTNIPADWNFYDLTLSVASCNVEAQFYGPPFNEHFVTGINGVRNAAHSYWTLWIFCQEKSAWTVSRVGVDLIGLNNGDTLAWAYQVLSSPNPTEPPLAGAKTVGSC